MLGNCFLLYRVTNVQIEAVGRDCTFARDTTKNNSLTLFKVRITVRSWLLILMTEKKEGNIKSQHLTLRLLCVENGRNKRFFSVGLFKREKGEAFPVPLIPNITIIKFRREAAISRRWQYNQPWTNLRRRRLLQIPANNYTEGPNYVFWCYVMGCFER